MPPRTLLSAFRQEKGAHADAFSCTVPARVNLAGFVTAFYTTPLFRAERWLLGRAGHQSADTDLPLILTGRADRFAIWRVRKRTDTELLMREISGPTASWFRVAPEGEGTRLWFGSALVPEGTGRPAAAYRLLTPLHLVYSRALLWSARRALARGAAKGG